ncbi:hypothetical protein PIB30_054888 [Stylosanthes scabra]|uniref:DUF4283 domain-containing protein n=1 Tax=Stylosanthes scabra TaxID=79078 RepID=A0ABU6ZHM2_9FABA|nr:hypothetical protein [Stylosanthes scabra]
MEESSPSRNKGDPKNHSLNEEEEESLVIYEEKDIAEGVQKCKYSIVGKLITEKPVNQSWVQNAMYNIWRKPEEFHMKEIQSKIYQFFFKKEGDMRRILNGSPWMFRNSWLLMERWERGVDPTEIDFSHTEEWAGFFIKSKTSNMKDYQPFAISTKRLAMMKQTVAEGSHKEKNYKEEGKTYQRKKEQSRGVQKRLMEKLAYLTVGDKPTQEAAETKEANVTIREENNYKEAETSRNQIDKAEKMISMQEDTEKEMQSKEIKLLKTSEEPNKAEKREISSSSSKSKEQNQGAHKKWKRRAREPESINVDREEIKAAERKRKLEVVNHMETEQVEAQHKRHNITNTAAEVATNEAN